MGSDAEATRGGDVLPVGEVRRRDGCHRTEIGVSFGLVMMSMNDERVETIDAMCQRYPREWVVYEARAKDRCGNPLTGVLIEHTPDGTHATEIQLSRDGEIYADYAGPITGAFVL